MNLVIDTSVLIAVITNEPKKPTLVVRTDGATLLAPASVHWEVGNAFSAMLKRGRITLAEAHQALRVYRTIPVRFIDVELDEVMDLVDQLNIYAYDGYILAAARNHRCPLLALDGGLIHAAKELGIEVLEIES